MLAGKDVLLIQEESVAMEASEDEEGAINDSSLDIVPENSEKMKVGENWVISVHTPYLYHIVWFIYISRLMNHTLYSKEPS